jgi:co-chaperonin GroES (HSP10)
MRIRPLQDRVVVELEPEQNESRGGILLLGHDPLRTGKVLRVGPGKQYPDKFLPTEVKKGERVAFLQATLETRSEAELNFRLPDNQVLIRETDILGVVEEGTDIRK